VYGQVVACFYLTIFLFGVQVDHVRYVSFANGAEILPGVWCLVCDLMFIIFDHATHFFVGYFSSDFVGVPSIVPLLLYVIFVDLRVFNFYHQK